MVSSFIPQPTRFLPASFRLLFLALGVGAFLTCRAPAAVDSGEVSLGELNCVACHAAPDPVRQRLASKQAPVLGAKGVQLSPQWLRAYLHDPQGAQPGTTMPDSLHGLDPAAKAEAAEALTHYLIAQQGEPDREGAEFDAAVMAKGRELYHTVGCVACHAPQEPPGHEPNDEHSRQLLKELQAGSAPLGDLASKTTVPQLAAFLKNPLATRPSGRMPASNLGDAEATAIALYLLRDQKPSDTGATASVPGLRYEYYEEALSRLPRFDRLQVKAQGVADQINLSVTRREDNVALRFRGNIKIPTEGEYTFIVASDDGAALMIDDKPVLNNDGYHAVTEGVGRIVLTRGEHALTVVYFNGEGGRGLNAYWEGPGFGREEIPASAFTHTVTPLAPVGTDASFKLDPAKIERGRALYASLNCASCHALEPATGTKGRALADLDPQNPASCIALHAGADRPQYAMPDAARAALQRTLTEQAALAQPLPPAARVEHTMTALNCYACHARDGHNGPEGTRRDYFSAAGDADLGDEGRFPPALGGVGAKLKPEALAAIFWQAAVARPYMATRMPQFGRANMEGLVGDLGAADDHDEGTPAADEPTDFPNAAAAGHKLAGTGGLGCIACHNFAGHAALGIPAIDMTLMYGRLKPAWFRRYLLDPQALRPGTRMPAFWPDGKASNQEVLAGDTDKQIAALRLYLAKGKAAELPDGLIPAKMELVARKEAIIYRNFIAGVSPRAIGVGYPEKANLAFDADLGYIALLWQGGFIDASRHRTGRGQGAEPPLGGNVVTWTPGAPFARLAGPDAPWPQETGRAAGYHFGGYHLDEAQRPTFRYRFGDLEVEDYPVAVPGEVDAGFQRTLRLHTTGSRDGFYLRAAVGDRIETKAEDTFVVDKKVTIKLIGGGQPIVRRQGEKNELLVPVTVDENGAASLEEILTW